jgi:HD superfamily phosphodiesterase
MKIYSTLINYAFKFVIETSKKYNIDDSHSLRHSIEVYQFANKIYNNEVIYNPFLKDQKNIIMCSAILHDMCDKKYVDEQIGIENMNEYFKDYFKTEELQVINSIITTMSYSTVKKNGYPEMEPYNLAYHIVREADLLAAYDIERCLIFQIIHENGNYTYSLECVKKLFNNRVLQYLPDNLFITEYSKKLALEFHNNALNKLKDIEIIKNELT